MDHPFLSGEAPKRVAIYIRVSTQEQKIEGYSTEAQRRRLAAFVQESRLRKYVTKPEWIFEDVHTGSDLNRPQLQKLIALIKKNRFDAVLVWKIDRFSRCLKHLLSIFETMEQHQVSFLSLQENIDFSGPIGRLIFQMFGAIAQFERELIKGRTRMGKITSAEMGNYTGTVIPYGYKPVSNPQGKGKQLVIVPEEKAWVEKIYAWNIYEGMGYQQIVHRLNELKVPKGRFGHKNASTGPWSEKQVRGILTNPIYRGEFCANKKDDAGNLLPEEEWTIVPIPRCVSDLTFHQASEARTDRCGNGIHTDYLLTGKLVDMNLEKPKKFTGCKRHKGGISYRRTQFTDKKGIYHPVFEIPGKALEEYVWDKILEAMNDPKAFVNHYLSKQYADPKQVTHLQQQIDHLRQRHVSIQGVEIPRIMAAYEKGVYEEDQLQERLTEKQTEQYQTEMKISELEDQINIMASATTEIESLRQASREIHYRLNSLTRPQKKLICQLFVDRVEMRRERRNGRQRWAVQAEIFFRFNPSKFRQNQQGGRTDSPDQQAPPEIFQGKNGQPGQRGRGSYTIFAFKIKFKSNCNSLTLSEL